MKKIILIILTLFMLSGCTQTQGLNEENSANDTILDNNNKVQSFADNLENCKSFSEIFNNPLTGEKLKREISGFENGLCIYTEQMPNGGEMKCSYSQNLRKKISKYYRNVETSNLIKFNVDSKLESNEVKSTYEVNGEELTNPLQEALDSGECIISGYDYDEENNDEQELDIVDEINDNYDDMIINFSEISNNENITIEWGEYKKFRYNMEDDWELDINIFNNLDEIIVFHIVETPYRGYEFYGDYGRVLGKSSGIAFDRIYHYYDDEIATFEKYKLTMLIYECNKLPKNIQDELCIMNFIDEYEIFNRYKKAGTPIQPTSVYTKYYEISSIETPPVEISLEEYSN